MELGRPLRVSSGHADPLVAEPRQRDLKGQEPEDLSGAKEFYEQSWAVVIGIDEYPKHPRLHQLKYAVSDAIGIARVLISRLGFPAGNVFLVVDPPPGESTEDGAWLAGIQPRPRRVETRATKQVLEEILFTRLPECAGPHDRVLVYFAGHGVRRPRDGEPRDATPYLVPADGQADDQVDEWHTYIDLNSLTRQGAYFRAKHVFYLLDACSSGLTGMRSRSSEGTSRYRKDLLHRRARQCLTASTAEQPAADAGYGPHSIFTGHVLEVLEGRDPASGEGLITATSLTSYVKQKVGTSDRSRQTPDGFPLEGHDQGDFVFSSPKAPLKPEEQAELARLLHAEVGVRLDEPSPTELADRLWEEILEEWPADSAPAAEALRERGRALLTLGKLDEATRMLGDLRLQRDPEALLLLGIARLRARNFRGADDILQWFVANHPRHAYAGWARAMLDAPRGKRWALLIGVGKYGKNPLLELRGCANDVKALERTLRSKLGFDDVTITVDVEATADEIRGRLTAFQSIARPEDSFVCYLAGNGMLLQSEQAIFASYDVDREAGIFVTESDIDALLTAIPARDKLLITDACHLAPDPDANPAAYRRLFGCGRREKTRELFSPDGAPRGAFSYFLERALDLHGNVPVGELVERITAELQARQYAQTPGCSGDPTTTLVLGAPPALEAIELADRWSRGRFSLDQVKAIASWLRQENIPARPVWSGIGRTLLDKGCYAEAVSALQNAEPASTWPSLVRARLMLHDYAKALGDAKASEAAARVTMDTATVASFDQLLHVLGHAVAVERHVLIATVAAVTSEGWTSDPTALLGEVTRALADCGVATNGDKLRIVRDVSKRTLEDAFAAFTSQVGSTPALFLFIGPGFEDTEIWLSSADEADSMLSDLPLSVLRDRASGCPNLTSAVFITQTRGPRPQKADPQAVSAGVRPVSPPALLGLGATTVVVAPPRTRDISTLEMPPPDVRAVVAALVLEAHPGLSAKQWLDRAGQEYMSVRGDGVTPLLCCRDDHQRALDSLRRIEHAPLHRAEELLTKLIEDREFAAEAWLHRAVVRGAMGRYREALADIDAAFVRQRATAAEDDSTAADPSRVRWPEAHYHQGRILLDNEDFTGAASALKTAIEQDDTRARAHYYRARAIRCVIKANWEQQGRESARRYLALGAPFGLDENIERFVIEHGDHA